MLEYRTPDGQVRRELRPPEEVFHEDSLESLRSCPVIEGHAAIVTPENYRELTLGHVSESSVRADGDFVAGETVVQDGKILPRIDSGELGEISMGYSVREDATPGVWNGQPYDLVQRDIRYNHVALLPPGHGRAGRECALRLDSLAAVLAETDEPNEGKEPKMKIRIDGKDYEFGSQEHIDAVVAQERKRAEQATARADAADERVRALETELATAKDPARFDAAVRAAAELRSKAVSILGKDFKFDGKSEREVMIACVAKTSPTFTGEGKSNDYVTARFDALNAPEPVTPGVADDAAKKLAGAPRADATDELDSEAAHKRMIEANRKLGHRE